jgi:uncharacterized membrane protein YebE (DUF533 family)
MDTKFISAIAAIFMATTTVWAASDVASPDKVAKVEQRMANFKKRIDSGKANQSLTPSEATKADAEYEGISKMIASAKADGKVSQEELNAIQERQNAFSKSIHAEKHDTEGKQLPDKKTGTNKPQS